MTGADKTKNLLDTPASSETQKRVASALVNELGLTGAVDMAAARESWMIAAKQGDTWAQSQVAQFLEKGLGGPKDEAQAQQWRLLAAKQGFGAPAGFRSNQDAIAKGLQNATSSDNIELLTKRPEWAGKVALVVEDSRSTRMVIKAMLQSGGLQVLEAENGSEAFELLLATPRVDIVFTDVHMPILNSLGLAKKIRSIKGYKNLPIIMATIESKATAIEEGRNLRVSGWLIKPINASKLTLALSKLVVK